MSLSGIGVEELRPRAFDQAVGNDGLDLFAVARDALHRPFGLETPLGRVEQDQFAHAGRAVVPGDHANQLGGVAGDGLGIEGGIRPIGIALVVGHLAGTVRVHLEQESREVMGRVGVFPAGVEHAAVVEHRGAPVLVLVETQLADARPVGVHDAQIGHVVAAAHAGHAMEGPRRGEEDAAVGEVAGIEVVHVRFVAGRDLPQAAAVDLDFPNLPDHPLVGHGEEQLVGVEVELHVADELRRPRLQQRGQFALRADGREHGDLVVVAVAAGRAVGLPVLRQAQAPGAALDQQEFVEGQERIGQQGVALQDGELVGDLGDTLFRPLVAGGQGRFGLLEAFFQFRQAAEEFRALGIFAAVGGNQVLDRRARAGQAAEHGKLPGAARRKIGLAGAHRKEVAMAAGLVVDLQEQPVHALLQVEDDGVVVGRDAAGHVLREELLAVEPHLQPVVAAEAGRGLGGLVGGDGAIQVGRHMVAARQVLRLAVAPLGTGRPQRLAGGALRGKIDALFREQHVAEGGGLQGAGRVPRTELHLGGGAAINPPARNQASIAVRMTVFPENPQQVLHHFILFVRTPRPAGRK